MDRIGIVIVTCNSEAVIGECLDAALRTGGFESVLVDGKLYGYVRSDGSEEFLVLLNAGRSEALLVRPNWIQRAAACASTVWP